jgi:cyclin-dependent kinase-like
MNKYEVLGAVGEGAYGVVLQCRNKESGEIVAIKKFKESDDDEGLLKTTLREVKVLRLLRHPNIVSLTEAFRRKGKLFLVFEFVEKNLLEVLEEQPQGLRGEMVKMYIYQLCQAIHWCHSHNVIHRDIKPENLLISGKTKLLKLCDFGFARLLTKSTNELTDYVATRWYRAPELLLGSTGYSFEVDIWAIGCIMGEITDGQPIFPGESEVDQLYIVQKVLGPLIPAHLDLFAANPRFSGLKFPDMSKPETLQKKYVGKLGKSAFNFLQSVLRMNPAERPSSAAALEHPFFEDARAKQDAAAPALPPRALQQQQQASPRAAPPSDSAQREGGGREGSSKNGRKAGAGDAGGGGGGGILPNPSNKPTSKEGRSKKHAQQANAIGMDAAPANSGAPRQRQQGQGQGPGPLLGNKFSDMNAMDLPAMVPDYASNGGNVSQHQLSSFGVAASAADCPAAAPPSGPLADTDSSLRAETPVGNPPSRQKGRRSRAGPGAATGAAEREKERARELEREVERERERQRDNEMRSFREFSTKLPIVLRAPNARSAVLGGAVPDEATGGTTNIYDSGVGGSGMGGGLLPLKYDGGGGGGGGGAGNRSGVAGLSPPSALHSMGRIAPLDRGSKDALPPSRQSSTSRQGSRQQGQGQGQAPMPASYGQQQQQQDFGPRITTPISNLSGAPVAGGVPGNDYYMGGGGGGGYSSGGAGAGSYAMQPMQPSGGYSAALGQGHGQGQGQGGAAHGGPGPGPFYSQPPQHQHAAAYRSGNGGGGASSSNGNNFAGNQPQALSHLPQLQYSNGAQDLVYSNGGGGGGWEGESHFNNAADNYNNPPGQGGQNPHNIQKYTSSSQAPAVAAPAPRGHGPGASGAVGGAHAHHRAQVR